MTWVPVVILMLRYVLMMLEAISNPNSVQMVVNGTAFDCAVTKTGPYNAKITANFFHGGAPITTAYITVNGKLLAKAYLPKPKLCQSGPMELSGDF